MEHTSEAVYEGKLIHETTYPQRSSKYEEIAIAGIRIDFYDSKNKVIHEIKKSPKLREAHIWQLKYYIYILEKTGVEGVSGILEYPKERKTENVYLSTVDIERIKEIENKIVEIIKSEKVPSLEKKTTCRSCAYYDFCFVNEGDEY